MIVQLRNEARRLEGWLTGTALPVWAQHGRDPNGGFHERLTADLTPAPGERRFRVQARQTYCFALAGRLGWDGPWRALVRHGVAFMLGPAQRRDGFVHSLFDDDGRPQDAPFDLYDQTFALFALAHARQVLGEAALEDRAASLRERLVARLRRADGAFDEDRPPRLPIRANAHMHLLEAALAWCCVSSDGSWRRLADDVVELALRRFVDEPSGFIGEFFGADLEPAAGDLGRIVEPGHQFEWSWLLTQHAALCAGPGRRTAARLATRMAECGIDRVRNVAVDSLWSDGTTRDATARLWPQTERLKAALALAERPENGSFWTGEALAAAGALVRYLDGPAPGLWRDRLLADGRFVEESAPASSFYHIAGAIAELAAFARHADAGPPSPA